jgi:RNA polymerase sigma-70 factor (ECF subfamily)
MLRAHKSYDANQIRNPAAWFNRLVRNSCIDLYRLRAKSPSYAEPQEDTTATFGEASPHFPKTKSSEEELLSNEGLFETMAHIFELPEDLMEPLLLRCLAERPYEDIAVAMGLSNAAVRKRVQLGRRYLQETMSQQE